MKEYEFHVLAGIFPLLPEDGLKELSEGIKLNGLLEPITLYENKIIDGRNRYKACQLVEVEPRFEEYDGEDGFTFVIQKNKVRRQLNESQLALAGSRIANMTSGTRTDLEPSASMPKVISQPEAAKMLKVSIKLIGYVERILREAPDRIAQIESGEKTVGNIINDLNKAKREASRVEEIQEIEENYPDMKPMLLKADGFTAGPKKKIDLLLTDPLYSTDVEDIDSYAQRVVSLISMVKPDGRAYIFTGSYPKELRAYLNATVPDGFELMQVLVWSFLNTMGPSPKTQYKNNWQAIFYYMGKGAPDLVCPELNELFGAKEINAPDGRLGDRYHTWQKPESIAEQFIRHATRPGDIVYDPFAGTGTFLLAAAKLGRIAIGCENDEEMIKIAEERGLKCQVQ